MNYLDIKLNDVMNGKGVRTTLFVSGCIHECKGCYNRQSWDPEAGQKFTEDTLSYLLETLKPKHISGLSISGGDPLHPNNRNHIRYICDVVKQHYPEKDIWLWSGFRIEDMDHLQMSTLREVDWVIDGRYMCNKKTDKPFRGSDNQRLIKVSDIKVKDDKYVVTKHQ